VTLIICYLYKILNVRVNLFPCMSRRRTRTMVIHQNSLQWFILTHVPCILYYFVLWPTNARLSDKLWHS
jgi:hypothetical protein